MSMGRKMMGLGLMIGAFAFGTIGTPKEADAADIVVRAPLIMLGTPVALTCQNPGSHQDVSKTPILKNTTGSTIPKGQMIGWKSSDGDHGSVKLEADLAPNASVSGLGNAGQSYTCTASFTTSPDLTIKTAQFVDATNVSVQLQNLDAFADAAPSVVRVEVVACSGELLASANTSPIAVEKGQTKALSVVVAPTNGKKFLRVKADAGNAILERSETNNLFDAQETCIH